MARWFMMSYDAAEELYDLLLNENSVQRGMRRRRYPIRDFRKIIIKILRTKNVTIMKAVKTTIYFLDPSTDTDATMLNYWYTSFGKLGDEFKFIVGALLHYTTGEPVIKGNPDDALNQGFQELLAEVLQEEAENRRNTRR